MTSNLPPIVQAFSGALGSASANILTYPLDLATTRVQLDPPEVSNNKKRPKGIHRAILFLRHIVRRNGISALYDGIWSDTGATLLSSFFYFYFYSFLRYLSTRHLIRFRKPRVESAIPVHKPSLIEELLLGFIAGIASRAISTPLNIVTLRLQTERQDQSDDEDGDLDSSESSGMVKIIKDIYNEQGLPGFWRGFQTTALLSLNPSLTLAFFQLFRRLLTFLHPPIPILPTSGLQYESGGNITNKAAMGEGVAIPAQANPSPREAFVGAAVSNSIAVALLYPVILAKTRLQASSANSLREVIVDAYQGKNPAANRHRRKSKADIAPKPSIRGLYQGVELQIIKGFLSQGVTFLVKGRIEQMVINAYLRQRRLRG